jgi:hypothetical protein
LISAALRGSGGKKFLDNQKATLADRPSVVLKLRIFKLQDLKLQDFGKNWVA